MRNPTAADSRSGNGAAKTTPCCNKIGIKRGPWTAEEDEILAGYIKKEGEGQWRTLPKRAGLLRCGKSCRLRWMNYLRPHLKRGLISPDEEDLILRLHRLLGNRWSLIAGRIPGRTDNEIKNYWNTHLSKKLISQGLDPRTHKPLEIYYNPNPNNYYSSISDHTHNNNHHVRSSPAQDSMLDVTLPNPNNPSNDPFTAPLPPPPPPPPVILNQEASTSYGNKVGEAMVEYPNPTTRREEVEGCVGHLDGSNYNDEMFSSFVDLDSLIMNDDNQMFQGQAASMMMMMQQPMGYGSNSQGFEHYGSVWGSEVSPIMTSAGFFNQRDQGNRNLDPAQMHKK